MKRRRKRTNNYKSKALFYILFIILFVLIIDKLTVNKFDKTILQLKNNKVIKNNPESLIISVKSDIDQIATIPLISFNEINIDWGDGTEEKFISYKTKDNSTDNLYNSVIIPKHMYEKKGIYNIIITGDSKRGMFGSSKFSTVDEFGKKMFSKEFLDQMKTIPDNYTSVKIDGSNEKREILKYNILQFKNLNFKAIGYLTPYFNKEIPLSWINEFEDIEIFIDTFAYSDIINIPENIFVKSNNLRILSGTFMNCNYLKEIPDNLIENIDRVENLRYCFSNSKNIEGNAPIWWLKTTKDKSIEDIELMPYFLCFNECEKLDNYNEIPFLWGGILKNDEGEDL